MVSKFRFLVLFKHYRFKPDMVAHTLVPAFKRQKEEDIFQFETGQDYRVTPSVRCESVFFIVHTDWVVIEHASVEQELFIHVAVLQASSLTALIMCAVFMALSLHS